MNILNLDSCTHPPQGVLQGQILPSPSRHCGTDPSPTPPPPPTTCVHGALFPGHSVLL